MFAQRNLGSSSDVNAGCTVADGACGGLGEEESEWKLVTVVGVLLTSCLGPGGSGGAELVSEALGWMMVSCASFSHRFQSPSCGI
jgi:hypothetical protein